jgi:O-antigen/teichoic acid export membrane protein/aminoglycoside phosphotransferase (APT) family kinase protein
MSAASIGIQARQRLTGLWRRESLLSTGHLLVINAVLNSGFGVAYWVLAARVYPPAVVAVNSAAISAMMLLAGVAQLNLMSALLRFVPTSGAAAGRMIRGAYLVGGGLSGVAAMVFVLGSHLWAPKDLASLLSPDLAISFVVATALWSLFVMQDNALVAVGRSMGVPIENMAFAVLKIILIVMFSLDSRLAGIWWSWIVAMAICVAGTNTYLFGRAVPAFARAHVPGNVRVASLRELSRFIGPDYLGALSWIACTSLVPLLVLDLTDPRHAAAFSLPWSLCLALYAVPGAFGQSLVAHGVRHQDRLDRYYRQALRHTLALLLPVIGLLVALAPYVLRLFGPWYASQGTLTLRLLALSTLPNIVVSLAVSRARVQRRMITVVVVLGGLCVVVLGLTVLLVPHLGIVGGGIAWLTAECVIAAALFISGHLTDAQPRLVRSNRGGVPGTVVRAALAEGTWECEHVLRTASDTAVIMVRTQETPAVLKVASTQSGVASLRREAEVLAVLGSDQALGTWRSLLPVPLDSGYLNGGAFLATSRLPGRTLQPGQARGLTSAAFHAIAPLHGLGRTVQVVDDNMLHRWLDEPAEQIARTVDEQGGLRRLVATLRKDLAGRPVTLGWTHGDFYPGNVLADTAGVSGIISWSRARAADLVALDLVFWLVTMSAGQQPRSFGARVAAGLNRSWTIEESRLIGPVVDEPVTRRTLVLLAWLRHVASNLEKSDRYATSMLWAHRNISPVLRLMSSE